jgi:hypothetical protein
MMDAARSCALCGITETHCAVVNTVFIEVLTLCFWFSYMSLQTGFTPKDCYVVWACLLLFIQCVMIEVAQLFVFVLRLIIVLNFHLLY